MKINLIQMHKSMCIHTFFRNYILGISPLTGRIDPTLSSDMNDRNRQNYNQEVICIWTYNDM